MIIFPKDLTLIYIKEYQILQQMSLVQLVVRLFLGNLRYFKVMFPLLCLIHNSQIPNNKPWYKEQHLLYNLDIRCNKILNNLLPKRLVCNYINYQVETSTFNVIYLNMLILSWISFMMIWSNLMSSYLINTSLTH